MRGATVGDQVRPHSEWISIHAPLAGCDIDDLIPSANNAKFQSTHPSRGATRAIWIPHSWRKYFNPRAPCGARQTGKKEGTTPKKFQSTRPVRGATHFAHPFHKLLLISIHAPRAGRDMRDDSAYSIRRHISIHAPRAGRDVIILRIRIEQSAFQSTRPVRGATGGWDHRQPGSLEISIHAPRAGRDAASHAWSMGPANFNPRAPCGARPRGPSAAATA